MDNTLLQEAVEKMIGKDSQVYGFHHIGGGEINQTYKVITNKELYFVKVHNHLKYPKIFEKEMFSLNTIIKTQTIEVCNPIGICEVNDLDFFFLEFIDSGPISSTFWSDFGQNLANLHKNSSRYFGFQEDNYIGNVIQLNSRISNWGQFYIKNRLLPNIRKAAENFYFNDEILEKFEKYFVIIEHAFPDEEPALMHGNLWKEHLQIGPNGNAILSNPSCYYGNREMEIAMTKMVGSFDPIFYEAYNATYPLQTDWEIRMDFCQMYHLLVNLNNYGLPYLPMIEEQLNKWV
jgi:fructosamine-3-kinase